MEKIQELALISRVCRELENHMGTSGEEVKAVAEFVVDLAKKSNDARSFGM